MNDEMKKLVKEALRKDFIRGGLTEDLIKQGFEMQEKFSLLFGEFRQHIHDLMMEHSNFVRNANEHSTKLINGYLTALTLYLGSVDEEILSITDKDLH